MGFTDHRPTPLSGMATNGYIPNEHRRRASMPLTPPPSSRGQYFAERAGPSPSSLHRRPPSISTATTYGAYAAPLSPPPTPVRSARPGPGPPPAYASEKFELPTHTGSGKGKARGAHHRRISTATVIKALEAQGRLPMPGGGVVLTPSKVASWMVILLCTAYVGSFLHMPSPVDLFTSHHARAPVPSTAVRNLADEDARHAWASELPYRVPGHQVAVPAHRQSRLGPDGFDDNIMLNNPDTFANSRDQPARRLRKKPMRNASDERTAKAFAAVRAAIEEEAPAPTATAAAEANERETFAVHPDLLADSPNRKFARPATGERGRAGPVNRLHRAKKPAAGAIVDSSAPAAAEAEEAQEEVQAKAAPLAKKKARKSRKEQKELAKHAAHALARAAERRKEKAKQAAAVDWSLEGDADEGDE